jgi:hypothetical protein
MPGGGPMPGGELLWPGKPPNPGGRPYGDSISILLVVCLDKQAAAASGAGEERGRTYAHRDCTP